MCTYSEFYPHQHEPLLVVISGPSGAGKDSVIKSMKARGVPFHFVVTATSRQRRPGEREGVDYRFLAPEEFQRRLRCGDFIEHAVVYGDHYGVPKGELMGALAAGRNAVLRVDVQGARTLRRLLPDAIFVFVMAESEDEHLRRLRRRGSETEQTLQHRAAKLRHELTYLPEFDYLVVNRRCRLEEAAAQLEAIATAERNRVARQQQRVLDPKEGTANDAT